MIKCKKQKQNLNYLLSIIDGFVSISILFILAILLRNIIINIAILVRFYFVYNFVDHFCAVIINLFSESDISKTL